MNLKEQKISLIFEWINGHCSLCGKEIDTSNLDSYETLYDDVFADINFCSKEHANEYITSGNSALTKYANYTLRGPSWLRDIKGLDDFGLSEVEQ